MISSRRRVRTHRATAMLASLGGVAAALLSIGVASPAAAGDDGGLELSRDGSTYSDRFEGQLFDDLGTIVPNDSRSTTLYLRNASADPAILRVTGVNAVASTPLFARALTLSASTAESGIAVARSFSSIGTCGGLLADQVVEPGESVPVDFALHFGDLVAQQAQGAWAGVDLLVTLRDESSAATDDQECADGIVVPVIPAPVDVDGAQLPSADPPRVTPSGTIGSLAFTGGSFYRGLVAAFILLGTGVFFVAASRRRRNEQ